MKTHISSDIYCITTDTYGIATNYHLNGLLFPLVKETDVEDEAGEILKEVYVQPVAPLEFHAGYRLASEDPAIFSDGG